LAKAMNKNERVYLILGIIPGASFFSSLFLLNSSNKHFKSLDLKIIFWVALRRKTYSPAINRQ
jgi:hypothetical protein